MRVTAVSYGDDQYEDLSELRAVVWEISGGQCEHPKLLGTSPYPPGRPQEAIRMIGRCPDQAVELAHIVPRGMGGSHYRNTVNNTMAACLTHARSTDDLSSPEWDHVPKVPLMTKREALATYLVDYRRKEGWAL